MNHRNRAVTFFVAFVALAIHTHEQRSGAALLPVLALQFLLYPHLLAWRARRSADPARTEIQHVFADAAVFGLWSALLSFPLWITFIFLVGATVNPTAFLGLKGLAGGWGSFLAGSLAGIAVYGFAFRPETSPVVTALCAVAVLFFLFTVAHGAYRRSMSLHQARLRLHRQLEEIRILEGQLRDLASRDSLTGLWNRRAFEERFAEERDRARRSGSTLGVVMLDVDHFKTVNDTRGHPAGDAVLRELAATLKAAVRPSDVVGRLGGEEFGLLLFGVPGEQVEARAEAIRAAWEAKRLEVDGGPLRSTLSAGWALWPRDGADLHELIAVADQGLYEAKRGGRNRVVGPRIAPEVPPGPA